MGEQRAERLVEIKNKLGLHARAANMIVKVANRYRAKVTLEKDGVEANGKSIMGLLMLAAGKGAKLRIRAQGEDASEAVEEIARLVEGNFGEE
ncbi:MAG: HPr family phosphocarrier protein [Deltaproteobacteria bacterium]|nr:MAG: HPr family phosphocarrier protein [Deltaproteobacteria bacterium]RLB03385.1 MAG: HPr family phosphocarrier protein [Deltaproteobacteria bacterium]